MLTTLYAFIDKFKYSPIHPQWIANSYHAKKLRLLKQKNIIGHYLDIGSGNCASNQWAASSAKSYLTLDYPSTAHRYQKKPNIYGDVQQLPLASDSVDCVIFFEVLEHVRDDGQAIAEISRILKNQGTLFISAPFLYPLHDKPYDFKRYTHFGLITLLEKHNLDVLETHFHGNSLNCSLQLINLAILDTVTYLFKHKPIVGKVCVIPAYLATLLINLLALPVCRLDRPNSMILGQTIIAQKSDKTS